MSPTQWQACGKDRCRSLKRAPKADLLEPSWKFCWFNSKPPSCTKPCIFFETTSSSSSTVRPNFLFFKRLPTVFRWFFRIGIKYRCVFLSILRKRKSPPQRKYLYRHDLDRLFFLRDSLRNNCWVRSHYCSPVIRCQTIQLLLFSGGGSFSGSYHW